MTDEFKVLLLDAEKRDEAGIEACPSYSEVGMPCNVTAMVSPRFLAFCFLAFSSAELTGALSQSLGVGSWGDWCFAVRGYTEPQGGHGSTRRVSQLASSEDSSKTKPGCNFGESKL